MGTLEGAVVVVTGAGRGLGQAIAEVLGQDGAKVVVNYSQSNGLAEDLVVRLKQSGSPESIAIQADVSYPAQAVRLIEETVKQFGRIDVLVNNAGINIDRTMKNITTDDWDKVIQVELKRLFLYRQSCYTLFHAAKKRQDRQHQLHYRYERGDRPDKLYSSESRHHRFHQGSSSGVSALQRDGECSRSRLYTIRDVRFGSGENEGGNPGSDTSRSCV